MEIAPATDLSPGTSVSGREAFAPAGAAPTQNGASATGAHAGPESVDLLPAAIVRLKGALHFELPRSGLKRNDDARAQDCIGETEDRSTGISALARRATKRCRQVFRCDPEGAGRTFRPSQTHGAIQHGIEGLPHQLLLGAPSRAVLHRGPECCDRRLPNFKLSGA